VIIVLPGAVEFRLEMLKVTVDELPHYCTQQTALLIRRSPMKVMKTAAVVVQPIETRRVQTYIHTDRFCGLNEPVIHLAS
jgi:hypothetical protein